MRRVRRMVSLLAAVGLAAGLAAVVVVGDGKPAQAEVIPPSGQWVELFNPQEPLTEGRFHVCLDVPSGTSQDVWIEMWHCHGYDGNGGGQRWTFVHLSSNAYWIQNVQSHKCLTPGRTETRDPTIWYPWIFQTLCGSADGQAWTLAPAVGGFDFFQLRNDSPNYFGKCLDGESLNGANVGWLDCRSNATSQTWAFG